MNNLTHQSTRFIDPERVLFAAGLTRGQNFADLGAGSGFYTLAASKITGDQGLVYSVDILESALDHVAAESRLKGMRNIKTLLCDLEQTNCCQQIPAGTVDIVLFANVVHQMQNPSNLFSEAYKLLKTGGKLLVIEWNGQAIPIGPASSERLSANDLSKMAEVAAFKSLGTVPTDNYHYGLVFIK